MRIPSIAGVRRSLRGRRACALLQPAVGVVLLGCGLAVAGCAASGNRPAPGARMVVSAESAPFYKQGPAQAFGADLRLAKGAELTLMSRGFGFSHVLAANGVLGYVPNEDLAPAPGVQADESEAVRGGPAGGGVPSLKSETLDRSGLVPAP